MFILPILIFLYSTSFWASCKRRLKGCKRRRKSAAGANFSRIKDVSPGGLGQLFKMLSAIGVSNEDEAKFRIQQLSTVQQQSKAEIFEEFIVGGVKSLIPQLAQGATPEFAAALDKAASSSLAAEQTKQSTGPLPKARNRRSRLWRPGNRSLAIYRPSLRPAWSYPLN